MNILIRDIPDSTFAAITSAAASQNVSRQELLVSLLEKEFGPQPSVFGYIKLDRPGDREIGDDCPACGEPAPSWWLQVMNTGEMHIMCAACATSE